MMMVINYLKCLRSHSKRKQNFIIMYSVKAWDGGKMACGMKAGSLDNKSQAKALMCVLSPGPTELVLFKILFIYVPLSLSGNQEICVERQNSWQYYFDI